MNETSFALSFNLVPSFFRNQNVKHSLNAINQDLLGMLRSLCKFEFKHSFQDTPNTTRTNHYLFHYSNYSNKRLNLLNKLNSIERQNLKQSNSKINKKLLFGKDSFNFVDNTSLLNATIEFILATKRFHDTVL